MNTSTIAQNLLSTPRFTATKDKNTGEVTRVQLHIPNAPVGKLQISKGEVISLTLDMPPDLFRALRTQLVLIANYDENSDLIVPILK